MSEDKDAIRQQLGADYRAQLTAFDADLRARFEAGAVLGLDAAMERSAFFDRLLEELSGKACALFNLPADALAMVATGGYGRGPMAPKSDIDLLFLKTEENSSADEAIAFMLYVLWDLNVTVGQSTRSIAECISLAAEDVTIATALLEARFICGNRQTYDSFVNAFESQVRGRLSKWFVAEKLRERDDRHQRQGDSRFLLEPNIKESKGSLRDLHALYWIARFLYGDGSARRLLDQGVFDRSQLARFDRAHRFLWQVRFHLHYTVGRADDRLTFDIQPVIAEKMGYHDRRSARAVERFMKHYFTISQSIGGLTRILVAAIEAEQNIGLTKYIPRYLRRNRMVEGFPITGNRLSCGDPATFLADPVNLLRLFEVAQRHRMALDPAAVRLVTLNIKRIDKSLLNDPEANRLFLEMLTSRKDPANTLRRLNEAGVLGRFIPDFGRIVGMMQFDRYHHYTVDEHTIFAVDNLHRLEQGTISQETPLSTKLMPRITARRALYVAVFLHDIAKGRDGAHEVLGEQVARDLCPRLGLDSQETELVAWLVRHHLDQSHVMLHRDLDDPKTIQDFAALVSSMEALRCLHVLTSADIRAVGPGVWTGWKAAMMRQVFFLTENVLHGGLLTEGREKRADAIAAAVDQALKDKGEDIWPARLRTEMAGRGFPHYWLSHDVEHIVRHFEVMRAADNDGQALAIDYDLNPDQQAFDLYVYLADHPGIFASVAGAIAISGGTIVTARAHSFRHGKALEVFTIRAVTEPGMVSAVSIDSLAARIRTTLPKVLWGELRVREELQKRQKRTTARQTVFERAPQVFIDNDASERHTVVEVTGYDRPGTLYRITRALAQLGLMIHTAKISPYGTRFVDVFYVQDVMGEKIQREDRQSAIKQAVLAALDAATDRQNG